jgi:hypothetical protein
MYILSSQIEKIFLLDIILVIAPLEEGFFAFVQGVIVHHLCRVGDILLVHAFKEVIVVVLQRQLAGFKCTVQLLNVVVCVVDESVIEFNNLKQQGRQCTLSNQKALLKLAHLSVVLDADPLINAVESTQIISFEVDGLEPVDGVAQVLVVLRVRVGHHSTGSDMSGWEDLIGAVDDNLEGQGVRGVWRHLGGRKMPVEQADLHAFIVDRVDVILDNLLGIICRVDTVIDESGGLTGHYVVLYSRLDLSNGRCGSLNSIGGRVPGKYLKSN